jgi:2-oxoglutarate ferredoxin oxidoreductase subunit alpha
MPLSVIKPALEEYRGFVDASERVVEEHIVEIVSDSGEGAQTAGQLFATVCARMGNGIWTTEIIPAEIEPPHRSRAGASGNRIRFGSGRITNAGDTADVVVALNEQVLYSRIDAGAIRAGTLVFLDRVWASSPQEEIRQEYVKAVAAFTERGYSLVEIPMEEECLEHVEDARRGKNMWALGMLSMLYQRDMDLVREEVAKRFARKGDKVAASNLALVEAGYSWAQKHLPYRFSIPVRESPVPKVVMNGNQALGLGIMATGMEVCAMYPITPATSVSHYLAGVFDKVGGFVHQAEDEIAALGFALGASYAGKTAVTFTSGPGLALMTEFLGLAVMGEIPVVVVVVQRGGPSTGLPTKVEQGDLLAAMFASPGDSPRIVMAPATIEECFHFMITARELAERYRSPVIVLTDANLATGQQPFPRPQPKAEWLSKPVTQLSWDREVPPYAWDGDTGLSERPIPGQREGMHVLTGLAHDEWSRVAYDSTVNQKAMAMRSRKIGALQRTLKPPEVHGDVEGDLLVVTWGSTFGAVEEAVDRIRRDGARVSSLHLRFLSPLPLGLGRILRRFREVMTVEINYSDSEDDSRPDEENRRHSQLARLLRMQTLMDVGCWSRVPGTALSPFAIETALRARLDQHRSIERRAG